MAQVKSLLKDAIVVGHDIRSDERALCFNLSSVAHRVIDTATNPGLNDLVPSEKGKIKSKLSGLAWPLPFSAEISRVVLCMTQWKMPSLPWRSF